MKEIEKMKYKMWKCGEMEMLEKVNELVKDRKIKRVLVCQKENRDSYMKG